MVLGLSGLRLGLGQRGGGDGEPEELVTNGGFDTDTVWVKGSTSGAVIAGGTLTVNYSDFTNNRFVYQTIGTSIGVSYNLQFDVITGNANCVFRVGNSLGSNSVFSVANLSAVGPKSYTFTADAVTSYISIAGGFGSDLEIDNVSVTAA